jgi:hypothetical protein
MFDCLQWTDGLSNESGIFENGRISCSFRRANFVTDNAQIFPLDKEYNLLFARGTVDTEGNILYKYYVSKWTSFAFGVSQSHTQFM